MYGRRRFGLVGGQPVQVCFPPSLETDVLNNFLTETAACTVCYPFPCIYIRQLARFDEFLIGAH